MSHPQDLQPRLRRQANGILERLARAERESLLIKSWMSHDARWFMAVARECGLPATNRLNRIAAHEIGKVEALRIVRALGLPPVQTLDDYLLMQEILIGFLGPTLLDYWVSKTGQTGYQVHIQRCFAFDNATRAGIVEDYECGILERVTGWMEALGLGYEVNPSIARCLKSQGQECVYSVALPGLQS